MATKKLTPADYIDEARRLADEKGDTREAAVLRWLADYVERAEKFAHDVDAGLSTTSALGGYAAVQAALCDFRHVKEA